MKTRTRKSVCLPRGIIKSNVQLPPTTESHSITAETITSNTTSSNGWLAYLPQTVEFHKNSSKNGLEHTSLKRVTPSQHAPTNDSHSLALPKTPCLQNIVLNYHISSCPNDGPSQHALNTYLQQHVTKERTSTTCSNIRISPHPSKVTAFTRTSSTD